MAEKNNNRSSTAASDKVLTTKQYQAIALLLEGNSVEKVADALGVARNTVDRWLHNFAFYAELKKAQATIVEQAVLKLTGGADKAIDIIKEIMEDDTAKPPVRLRACATYLDALAKFMELHDTAQRLSRLEQAVMDAQQPQGNGNSNVIGMGGGRFGASA